MKKRKSRSVATSRAAAKKAWRTSQKMRERRIADIGIQRYREEIARGRGCSSPFEGMDYLTNYEAACRRSLHQTTGRTIDLVPKVEWENDKP